MSIGDEIVRQSSGVLNEAYKDIVQPSAKPAGAVLSLIPRSIRIMLSRWERWVTNGEESIARTAGAIAEKAEKIPENRQREPEPYVAIPAIQQICYSYDSDELREMYANLLVNAMDSAASDGVHPSFVEIIRQLTPDEAKLLSILPREIGEYIPVVDVRIRFAGEIGYIDRYRNFSVFGKGVCVHPEKISEYLENLCRLKLIDIPTDVHLTNEELYEPLKRADELQLILSEELPEGQEFSIEEKMLRVTDYGLAFIRCCVDEYEPTFDEDSMGR